MYWFFTGLPVSKYFLTAVLLTPIDLPASVRFGNSNSSLVFKFLTVTGTPLSVVTIVDNLARVSSESLIPLLNPIFFFYLP